MSKHKWTEKWEKLNDYWEKTFESETKYTNHSGDNENETILREGKKEFKNNRSYVRNEQWKEYADGKIIVYESVDDGLGSVRNKEFEVKKHGD